MIMKEFIPFYNSRKRGKKVMKTITPVKYLSLTSFVENLIHETNTSNISVASGAVSNIKSLNWDVKEDQVFSHIGFPARDDSKSMALQKTIFMSH